MASFRYDHTPVRVTPQTAATKRCYSAILLSRHYKTINARRCIGIAKKKAISGKKDIIWDPGEANPKQLEFYMSRTTYTAYGGAKGGGKTHAVRIKAIGGAITNAGIKILIMRRTYPELEENHIRPIVKMVPPEIASYNATTHLMTFSNGSTIKFGHWQDEASEDEYNGLEYDWIFIDEATQFTERAFQFLGGCMRGVNSFPKRMYLTCNPGGELLTA